MIFSKELLTELQKYVDKRLATTMPVVKEDTCFSESLNICVS